MAEAPPRPRTVPEVVAFQATACEEAGSALYGRILAGVSDDLAAGGVSAGLLADGGEDPLGSALPLRFLGGMHRIVLEGRAPQLAAFYPSAGGEVRGDPVPAFLAALGEHREELAWRIGEGVQTNEVGRSAVLVGGFAELVARFGLPLRVLEVGASAGLNLRWDRYAYDTGVVVAGDPTSPVRFSGVWEGRLPELPERFDVAERRGCDRRPIDPTTEDGRLTLLSYVWPDQRERIAHLDAAIRVARQTPVSIDQADGPTWVAEQLATARPGVVSVVVHSIVIQYLSRDGRHQLTATMAEAGDRATPEAPLAWLRMEPAGDRADVRLTTWPGGDEEVLATAGYHGQRVWWRS